MKKALKIIVILAIIAAAAAAGWYYLVPMLTGQGGMSFNVAYVTRVSELTGEGMFKSNRYSAVVESQEIVNVDTDGDKKIKNVFVKQGDSVKKGDVLFEYDIEDLQFKIDQSRLERESSESEIKSYNEQIANLEKEQKNANISQNTKLGLQNQIEQTKLLLKKAEYNLSILDTTIKKLENSIKNSVVKASVDGTIKSLDDPTAESYITITSSGDFRLNASISEEHIDDFYVDEPITVRSRINEAVTWSGKVVNIDTTKPITSNGSGYLMGLESTTKYPVYIALDSTDGLLMGQHVTIEEAREDDTHKEGLWLDDYYIADPEGDPYVWVEQDGALAKRSVTLGEYDEENYKYEIKDGLKEDDYLAFPEDRLTEGMTTEHGFDTTGMGDMIGMGDIMG